VKSGIFNAKVACKWYLLVSGIHLERRKRLAFGEIAADIAEKNTTATGRPSTMFVGLLKTDPKPPADPTAQPNRTTPKIGIRTILGGGSIQEKREDGDSRKGREIGRSDIDSTRKSRGLT